MSHYKSNLRDIEFNLFEVFGRDEVLGQGPYEAVDADTAREMLKEYARLAENELAESFADADRNPPVFDPETSSVAMPESFKKSYKAFQDAGFWSLDLPEELDGTVAPPSLRWAMNELVLGANPAIGMFGASYSFAKLLYLLGNDEQKKLAKWIAEKGWHCTMVLTEPDAGSDVGAGRTKATDNGDGTWNIEGVKRFITSAESDMTDNIVHFVLARPEGAGPGTKGLSLFIVPKFHVDLETGELGERNGAYVTNVEDKMGLKVSTTCEVTFGDGAPAVGTLLGDVHDGIAQMFKVIENARMMVGTKAIATLSTGYLNALEYAKERVQGADLTTPAKDAPRVTITHHPDVRRSLMLQKAYSEGLRALGAELVLVPAAPYSNPGHFVHPSRLIAEETENAVWANQFDNVANRQAHIDSTAPEPGETAAQCALREVEEELGLVLDAERLELVAVHRTAAANEAGRPLIASVFRHPHLSHVSGPVVHPAAEIDEVRWTAVDEPLPDDVAPLLRWLVDRET